MVEPFLQSQSLKPDLLHEMQRESCQVMNVITKNSPQAQAALHDRQNKLKGAGFGVRKQAIRSNFCTMQFGICVSADPL